MTDTTETACANCGKAESDDIKLKQCTAYKLVRYCSSDCQVEHRPKHKKTCEKRAAELFDEELFKDPLDREECPICMLPLPFNDNHHAFNDCCGKVICKGCIYAQCQEDVMSGKLAGYMGCAFCRTPNSKTAKESINRIRRGVERNDANFMNFLGIRYMKGDMGVPKDSLKAMELFLNATKHGCAGAHYNMGDGNGVEKDITKATHCYALGAIGGCLLARRNLACFEEQAGNNERAFKHYLIGAKAGCELSIKYLQIGFKEGYITKDEYAGALRAYQKRHDEAKSAIREEAVAFWAHLSLQTG